MEHCLIGFFRTISLRPGDVFEKHYHWPYLPGTKSGALGTVGGFRDPALLARRDIVWTTLGQLRVRRLLHSKIAAREASNSQHGISCTNQCEVVHGNSSTSS